MDISLFIGGSSIIAVVLIGLLKKWIKDSISPRWGDLGVQVVLLAISFALAGIGILINLLPPESLSVIGAIFGSATVIYQVLIKSVVKKAILNKLDSDEAEE